MEVGERYIIEISDVIATNNGNLAKIKGFNALVFDENGLKKLSKVEIDPCFLTQRGVNESLSQERQYGYNNGYKNGYEDGNKEADKRIETARGIGYEEGHKEGYDKGYDDAKTVWYKHGYDEDFKAGEKHQGNMIPSEPNEPKPHEPRMGDIYRKKDSTVKIIITYDPLFEGEKYTALFPDGGYQVYDTKELNKYFEFVENRADILEPIKGVLA